MNQIEIYKTYGDTGYYITEHKMTYHHAASRAVLPHMHLETAD